MTQVMQPVSVDIILKHTEDCPFCKSNQEEKPNPVPESKDVADWEEDPGDALIGNSSGELEKHMDDPRPTDWIIDISDLHAAGDAANHKVVPNPHHLIPGNESLKCAEALLEWIFAEKGKIENDIGYNVNNGKNGVWLPSNNGMRGVAWWEGDAQMSRKVSYVERAMDKAKWHFHDRHGAPYSEFVTKILNKIADRMNGDQKKECPFKTSKSGGGKYRPPYALVARLNGVSARIRPYLMSGAKPNRFLFTSKLVMQYWARKKMLAG